MPDYYVLLQGHKVWNGQNLLLHGGKHAIIFQHFRHKSLSFSIQSNDWDLLQETEIFYRKISLYVGGNPNLLLL